MGCCTLHAAIDLAGIAAECIACAEGDNTIWYRDASQTVALVKSTVVNAGDAVRNRNIRQAGTAIKSIAANAGNAFGNVYANQAAALEKSTISNAGDTLRDGNAGQAAAVIESTVANAGDALLNHSLFNLSAPRNISAEIGHIPASPDGQHAVVIQRPGNIARHSAAFRHCLTAVYNHHHQNNRDGPL